MNSTVLCKRLTRKENTSKIRIRRYARWRLCCPSSGVSDYLKGLIIEEQEQLNALSRSYIKNFNRRVRTLENILAAQHATATGTGGVVALWKRVRVERLQEEHSMLAEIQVECAQFKYTK